MVHVLHGLLVATGALWAAAEVGLQLRQHPPSLTHRHRWRGHPQGPARRRGDRHRRPRARHPRVLHHPRWLPRHARLDADLRRRPPNRCRGHRLLRRRASSPLTAGIEVLEVNCPDRADRRRRGKDDTLDAENAAHAALAGTRTITPKTRTGMVESLRVLRVARSTAVKARRVAGR